MLNTRQIVWLILLFIFLVVPVTILFTGVWSFFLTSPTHLVMYLVVVCVGILLYFR